MKESYVDPCHHGIAHLRFAEGRNRL